MLKIASTGKDPVSGKLVTHEYIVEGPVMIFLTTTAQEVDEELLNRCIVLTVNEDREQTRAIHRRQREARTSKGYWRGASGPDRAPAPQRAAALAPIAVVNNQRDEGEFPDYMTRTRRDHMKLLTLIRGHCAAASAPAARSRRDHARRRDAGVHRGHRDDVKLARAARRQVLGPSLDELPPQTRRLLLLIERDGEAGVRAPRSSGSEYRFTRRTVRQYTRWGDTQLRPHLRRLEELEYLVVRRGGPGQTSSISFDGGEEAGTMATDARRRRTRGGRMRTSRGVRGDCAGCRNRTIASKTQGWEPLLRGIAETHIRGEERKRQRHRSRTANQTARRNHGNGSAKRSGGEVMARVTRRRKRKPEARRRTTPLDAHAASIWTRCGCAATPRARCSNAPRSASDVFLGWCLEHGLRGADRDHAARAGTLPALPVLLPQEERPAVELPQPARRLAPLRVWFRWMTRAELHPAQPGVGDRTATHWATGCPSTCSAWQKSSR